MKSQISSIANNRTHLPCLMPTIPILLESMSSRFLHNKAHVGVSRKTRGRKHQHSIGILSNMNQPSYNKIQIKTPKSAFGNFKFPIVKVNSPTVQLISLNQIRPFSSSDQCVTDEADFDASLHKRESAMHRHKRSPLKKIVKLAKDVLYLRHDKEAESKLKVLDIASSPIDPPITLAKELPHASMYTLNSSRDMLKVVSDKLVEEKLSNITTKLSDLVNLTEFDDSSFNLVISCYGLQNSADPAKLVKEIHRVLKPGGTMIVAIWEHLGTKPIVDRILDKLLTVKMTGMERTHLMRPHVLEKMVEDSGLRVVDINHGEYPFYLSSADGLHGSAFDITTLPIKKELAKLMQSGNRPYAFEDAREEFDNIVNQGQLVTTDSQGRLVVEDNRYKIVVARRQYDDLDRERDIEEKRKSIHKPSKIGLAQPDIEAVKKMANDFNLLLTDTLDRIPNSPWKCMLDSVKRDVAASGHDASKKVNILDLASYPNHSTKMMAKALPDVNIHSTDLASQEVTDMKTFTSEHQLDHITPTIISERQLKDFKNSSMDIVTCSFGLTRFSDPESILNEVHRVLKPGGSFITTTWHSIALERIGEAILSGVMDDKDPHVPTPILNLTSYSEPRKLERLIESTGNLGIAKVEHFEFPFYLGNEGDAFDNAIIPIRHLLKTLEETGVNPNAFDDARNVYQGLLKDNQLMWKDDHGEVMTVRNRYKFMVARRKFEDSDGLLDKDELDRYNRDH